MPKFNIKSKPERLRRAGVEFSRAGIEVDTDELSPEQVELIKSEPNLVITGGDIATFVSTAKAEKKKAK